MHDVLASVAALPDDERDALLQSAVHGGSGRQIAGSLGVDESTVRQLVFRARATLRAAAAAIVTPPLLFARFAHRISGTTHRFGADSRVLRSLSQADTAGRLVRMGATAVAALALVGSGALHAIDVPHQTPLTSHASQRRAATRSVATSRVVRAVRPAATGVRGRSTTSPPAANVLPQPAHPGQSLATNMPQALKGAAQGVFQQVATVAAPVVSQAAAKAVPGAAQSVSSASGGDAAGIVPGVPGL
jgi:hypothetical protein